MKSKAGRAAALLLALILALGVAGCGKQPGPAQSPDLEPSEPAGQTQGVPSQEPSREPTQEPSQEPSDGPTPDVSAAPSPSASPSPAPQEPSTMDIAVYYLKNSETDMYLVREVHTLPKSEGVARAALNELISGTPQTEGAFKVLNEKTQVLGINISDGTATVDFSKDVLIANVGSSAEALGIASIVNTLTEFPTIKRVQFTVEGSVDDAMDWWGHIGLSDQPFERDISMVYEPIIWLITPKPGQTVSSPLRIAGNALIFEATVSYRLTDSKGKVLAEGFTMADKGAPERGDFDVTIEFSPTSAGSGQLEVFEISMKDGSEVNKVTIPVVW